MTICNIDVVGKAESACRFYLSVYGIISAITMILKMQETILRTAFDNGITHFDLANNYGPPYGSAEKNFGKIFKEDLKPYRDQLIISTKAG